MCYLSIVRKGSWELNLTHMHVKLPVSFTVLEDLTNANMQEEEMQLCELITF
jgi:hypothetical protein